MNTPVAAMGLNRARVCVGEIPRAAKPARGWVRSVPWTLPSPACPGRLDSRRRSGYQNQAAPHRPGITGTHHRRMTLMKRLLLLSLALAAALPSCDSEKRRTYRSSGRVQIYMSGLECARTEADAKSGSLYGNDGYFRDAHLSASAKRDQLFAEYGKWLSQAEMADAFARGQRYDYRIHDVNTELRKLEALP